MFMDEEKQTTYIDFFVQYPVVEGLSGSQGKRVNEILKACAMESVEDIYENPSQETKVIYGRVLQVNIDRPEILHIFPYIPAVAVVFKRHA